MDRWTGFVTAPPTVPLKDIAYGHLHGMHHDLPSFWRIEGCYKSRPSGHCMDKCVVTSQAATIAHRLSIRRLQPSRPTVSRDQGVLSIRRKDYSCITRPPCGYCMDKSVAWVHCLEAGASWGTYLPMLLSACWTCAVSVCSDFFF